MNVLATSNMDARQANKILLFVVILLLNLLLVLFLPGFPALFSPGTPFSTATKNSTKEILVSSSYLKDSVSTCNRENIVLNRDDERHEQRPYSITKYTFDAFHQNQQCRNSSQVLDAIKYGTRHWVNLSHAALPSIEREKYPSYFIPYACDIPYLSATESCMIMSKYNHIVIVGDSLTRHFRQGLLMTLRNDLILGGIESTNKYGADNPYSVCRCDGQFSEHMRCRQNNGYFDYMTPRDLGLCSGLSDKEIFRLDFNTLDSINCEEHDNKGVLLYLQGGPLYGMNQDLTMTNVVNVYINHTNYQKCVELNKIHVIWNAANAQSRALDEKYPFQSRANALIFNNEMNEKIKIAIPNVTIIDWWNLTADSQTSDGFHYLSDVNLIKAQYFSHLLQHLS